MTFTITTVYPDGTTETRDATPEEVAQREADTSNALYDLSLVRAQRNALLARSDWTQLADSPLSQELRDAWSQYRQRLRDVPNNASTTEEVIWPTAPEM
jgi:hypothetical protein